MDSSFGAAVAAAEATFFLTAVLVVAVVVGGIGYAGGRWHASSKFDQWAVENGYAEYVMDPASGKSHVEWIAPVESK